VGFNVCYRSHVYYDILFFSVVLASLTSKPPTCKGGVRLSGQISGLHVANWEEICKSDEGPHESPTNGLESEWQRLARHSGLERWVIPSKDLVLPLR